MPVATRGAVRHLSAGGPRAARLRGRPGQHLPPVAPPGRRGGGRPGRPARVHGLARPRAHRLRRLPGLLAGARRWTTTAPRSAPPTTATSYRFTPESAVAIQELLGADIQMVLDVCPPLPVGRRGPPPGGRAHRGLGGPGPRRPHTRDRDDQCLFGIVQGGVDVDLRAESAERTVGPGLRRLRASGGCRWGSRGTRCCPPWRPPPPRLPADQPRYLMGVGDPVGLRGGASPCGVDLFDCVLPTRLGRHGTILTDDGSPEPAEPAVRRRRRAPGPGLRLSRCAPGTPGPTCATCSRPTSPPGPAC